MNDGLITDANDELIQGEKEYADAKVKYEDGMSRYNEEMCIRDRENTAYHLVSEYLKSKNKKAKVFVVHRLDKDTSGILMFAKNEEIKNKLQNNWNKIVYKRGYLAIIEGKLNKKSGTIKNYLDESKTQMVYITNNKKGKLAITNYQVLKETRYNSLVEIFLDTGRKNQIRVHMQSLGHSIVGDKKYGATTNPIKRMGPVSYTHLDVYKRQ